MLSNGEILQIYLDNGLIKTCIECQFSKIKYREFQDDFFQDLCLIILEYDNEKLNDAHINNHMNALLSRIIINNLWSSTSKYYKNYIKYLRRSEDINIINPDTYEDK